MKMPRTRNYIKEILWTIFGRSRGGITRLRMISIIRRRPLNTNQLANELGIDRRAILHHVDVLERNNLIKRDGNRFGAKLLVSGLMEVHMELLEEILRNLQKRKSIELSLNCSRQNNIVE